MSSGRVVRLSPMAEGRAQLKQKSNNRSQRLRDTPAFPIFSRLNPTTEVSVSEIRLPSRFFHDSM